MFDAVFGIFFSFGQVMMILMGLTFFSVGSLMIGYPLWQILTWTKVKARIVEVRAKKDPFKEHEEPKPEEEPAINLRETMQKTPSKFIGVAFASFFLIGIPLLFVGIGAYFAIDYAYLKTQGTETTGHIVRFEEQSSDEGYTYAPVVRFSDAQGIERVLTYKMSSSSQMGLQTGQEIQVFYEQGDPAHFIIDRFWYNMILPVAFMAMGGFVLFFMVFFGFRKEVPRKDANINSRAVASNIYYSVYEYMTPEGRLVQAQCDGGSSALGDKVPGSEVTILLKPSDYETPSRPSVLIPFLGLFFAGPGVFVLYQAFSQFEFTVYTALAFLGVLAFIAFKISKHIKPKAEWESLGQFKSRMKQKNSAKVEDAVPLAPAEVHALLNQSDRMTLTWMPVSVVIILAMIVGGFYLYKNQQQFQNGAVAASGEVVRLISRSDSEGTTYYPYIRFQTAQGQKVEFQDNVGSNPPSYKSGDEVKILYLPQSPHEAIVDRGWMNQLPGIALIVVGSLFLLVSTRQFLRAKTRLSRQR